ncbi:MAG: DNA adenine methylase [Thermomicrobiales bacterium]
MNALPFAIGYVGTPPIKCQGIKTKLVPFIFRSIKWNAGHDGRWIEPFLGSGVVALNLCPDRALLIDTNRHIIGLYQAIQQGEINATTVRAFLTQEGKKLSIGGAEYYYEVRERFNRMASPYDFIFLNRSCFNGVMRFNRHGEFNVPFGHKPQRFSQAYITKIANQVKWAAGQMRGKDWEFRVAQWDDALSSAQRNDFVYMDPPYIGRHTDYYNTWGDADAVRLASATQGLPCGFALSMWLENRYRKNSHIEQQWSGLEMRVCSHFYHVGSTEDLRNEIDEALILKTGFGTTDEGKQQTRRPSAKLQLALALEPL